MRPHFIALTNFISGLTSLTPGSGYRPKSMQAGGMGWPFGPVYSNVLFWHTAHFAKIFEQLCTLDLHLKRTFCEGCWYGV